MQMNEPIFKWEVLIADEKIEMTDKQYQQLVDAIERNVKVLKFADKMINPTYFKSSKKVYKEEIKPVSAFLDWADINHKVVNDEQALSNREKIKNQIKQMLKEKNKDWKPAYKDPIHMEAVADVWQHLKSVLTTLKYPEKDDNWKLDTSITKHKEGAETHSVTYYTKMIDLGDKYDEKFYCEANYIFCPACKKELRKQIVLTNDYESEILVREM